MRPHTRRVLSVVAVALVALLLPVAGLGGAAGADHRHSSVEKQILPFDGFYYGDFDAELILLAGSPVDARFCDDVGYPNVKKSFRQRRDGTWTERWRSWQRVRLYSTPLGAPEYVEEQCTAIAGGAPPPEPYAVGRGLVRSYISALAFPAGPPVEGTRIVNRTFGFVRDDRGRWYRVKAHADLVLDGDLNPIGSPVDFQGLTVKRVGWRR